MIESNGVFVHVSRVSVPFAVGVYRYQTDRPSGWVSPAWLGSPDSNVASTVVPFTEPVAPVIVWAEAKASLAGAVGPLGTRFQLRVMGPLWNQVPTTMRYVVPPL